MSSTLGGSENDSTVRPWRWYDGEWATRAAVRTGTKRVRCEAGLRHEIVDDAPMTENIIKYQPMPNIAYRPSKETMIKCIGDLVISNIINRR
jgi:hypothetical protein